MIAAATTPQFSPRQDTATGFQKLTGLAVADFNGDGKPDIAVTDVFSKRIVVYLNSGTGTLASPVSTPLQFPAVSTGQIVAGDFNEDGRQDLILSTVAGTQQDILLTGNGDGTFTQQAALPGSFGFFSAAAIDVNHDSHLDLIGGGNGILYVHLGDGHGGFTLQPFTNQGLGDAFFGVTAGDFNNDRNLDFLATTFSSNGLRYFSGLGNGSFASPSNLSSKYITAPSSVISADFNGDGKLDLLIASSDIASIVFGNGDGMFQLNPSQIYILSIPQGSATSTSATSSPLIAAADMDGDGKTDAVAIDPAPNSLNVFINDGSGTFPQPAPNFSSVLPAGSGNIALADMNADGLPDIVITNYLTQNISVFLSIKPRTTPAVTLTASASQQLVGTPLTFIAKVAGTTSTPASGMVTLLDGATTLGQQTLDATGQASFPISNLSAASHLLSVTYPGDKNYLPATSSTVTQAVTDFQITIPAATQAVSRGSSAVYSLTLTPVAGLTGAVQLTCSGLPSTSTCLASSASLAGQPVTVTLTVTTTAASSQSTAPAAPLQRAALGIAAMLLTLLVPRHRRPSIRLLSILPAIVLLASISGCGGASSAPNPGSPGSPSGSTVFTVTASTTQGTLTVTHQASPTLTVN